MTNCISLFWEFLVISRRRLVRIWHVKKMAAVSQRPIKTQTCYVMVFTPYSSRCSPASRLLFGNLTGDVSTLFWSQAQQQDSGLKYVMLTVHPNTAGFVLNILRDTAAKQKPVSNPWSLQRKSRQIFLTGLSPKIFFFLFRFYSCRGAYLSVCCVSQHHPDSHSHSYTRSHLGAAEYKRSLLLESLRGEAGGGEASLRHPGPDSPGRWGI